MRGNSSEQMDFEQHFEIQRICYAKDTEYLALSMRRLLGKFSEQMDMVAEATVLESAIFHRQGISIVRKMMEQYCIPPRGMLL
ncbi:hypothetical protein [Paenibacillus sp. QZ-Y1]|uniref:hypothetical protein n=1 Tax=Paenibacillus sp. QZ-Y1 TaxID=3414511 RepID=UPI003F7AC490